MKNLLNYAVLAYQIACISALATLRYFYHELYQYQELLDLRYEVPPEGIKFSRFCEKNSVAENKFPLNYSFYSLRYEIYRSKHWYHDK